MTFIDSLPSFWQGVVASVVAALILTLAGFILRISSSSVREWLANHRGAIAALRQQLSSDYPTVRSEATLQILFSAAKWLLIAALLYGASSVPVSYLSSPFSLALRVLALACLIISLWWIYQYQQPIRATSNDWSELLSTRKWVLVFNPPHRSKPITFLANGFIGDGNNNNEHSWRVNAEKLELVQADGRVHSRFTFNPRTTSFLHTNDPDTLSIRGQFIVLAGERG